jgi:predicted CoA-binding protein
MRSTQQILADASVIAVVGASRDPSKPAHTVPRQMIKHGWRIIPVNPFVDEVFGVKAYKTLADIDEPFDLVDIFRPARDAVDIVR